MKAPVRRRPPPRSPAASAVFETAACLLAAALCLGGFCATVVWIARSLAPPGGARAESSPDGCPGIQRQTRAETPATRKEQS